MRLSALDPAPALWVLCSKPAIFKESRRRDFLCLISFWLFAFCIIQVGTVLQLQAAWVSSAAVLVL